MEWNIQSNGGWTAAMWAVYNKHVENVKILLTIPDLNWNLRSSDDKTNFHPNGSALTMAFEKGNEEIINLVLSAEGLELDVDNLKKQNVFEKAVTACQEFVLEKMGDDGIKDKEMITLFALESDMDEFAKILGM